MSVEGRLSKLEMKNTKLPSWFWVWRYTGMTDEECIDYSEKFWREKVKPDDEIHWIRVVNMPNGELAEAPPLYNIDKHVYEDYRTGATLPRATAT